tara:strand:- start:84 stop:1163 length:1080 start_codon:yes stop_codon:yes gene_type:complete
MAIPGSKLVTKAASEVVEPVLSKFSRFLFKGVDDIPSNALNFAENLNSIDRKTIINSSKQEGQEVLEQWRNMITNAGSDDLEIRLLSKKELQVALQRFRGESKLIQKDNRIEDMLMKNSNSQVLTGKDLAENAKRIRQGLQEFPKELKDRTLEIEDLVKQKKLERAPQNKYEAVFLGTDHFDETKGGTTLHRMIRQFRTESKPWGRTDDAIKRPGQRGKSKRIKLEELLTRDKDKGFYLRTPEGYEAHHWNPVAVLGRVVEGMTATKVKSFLNWIEKDLQLFSGNDIGNLRQLPKKIHIILHRRLEELGYNPNTLQSFAGASLAKRKAFMKKLATDLKELEKEIFQQVMEAKHGEYKPQ